MARKVFFSFHYGNDVNRANIVRNSWVTKGKESTGFIDKAEFESIKRIGKQAVQRWIDEQLKGTSATVVLIGAETLDRPYVQYELEQSYKRGNAIIGVKIGNIRDMNTKLTSSSQSIIQLIGWDDKGNALWFDDIVRGVYDYILEDGYNNLGTWIERANVKL